MLSIEPVPETYAVLERLVRRRRLANVTTLACAASDLTGVVRMEVPSTAGGFYEARVSSAGTVAVQADTLDGLLAEARPVSFIKIDAEGHEAAVIRGALRTLERDRPALLIEVSAHPDETADAEGMFGALKELSYTPCGPDLEPWDGVRRETNWFFLTREQAALAKL